MKQANTQFQQGTNAGWLSNKWLANVTYKLKDGRRDVSYAFNDPEELGDLIEAAQERGKIVEIEILLLERAEDRPLRFTTT